MIGPCTATAMFFKRLKSKVIRDMIVYRVRKKPRMRYMLFVYVVHQTWNLSGIANS